MTREEAIDVLKRTIAYESDFAEAKKMAIESLSAEAVQGGDAEMTGTPTYMQPSPDRGADLISRADIQYHTQLEPMGNGQYSDVEVAYKNDIDALPSADIPTKCIAQINIDADEIVKRIKDEYEIADRPSGEWVDEGYQMNCSVCGADFDYCDNDCHRFNYCPNCGADMRNNK